MLKMLAILSLLLLLGFDDPAIKVVSLVPGSDAFLAVLTIDLHFSACIEVKNIYTKDGNACNNIEIKCGVYNTICEIVHVYLH